jgi:glycosyltransferase involved in cell wall biosynthesis
LTTALGKSQVLAVTEKLQAMGWECTILSLEPEPISADAVALASAQVAKSGVRWRYRPYRWGRAAAPRNAWAMMSMVREVRADTDLFHCRSYFGAFFPAALGAFGGVPYVFDTRGYWVDEKIEAGRWFQDAASLAVARRVERQLYDRAAGVVCLTELAAQDVRDGRFGKPHPCARSICIPTCVDYGKFEMEKREPPHDFLREGLILGYVGSLNPSYEYRKSLELAASILARLPDAKLLALTSQVDEMGALADEHVIPEARRLITRVPHGEIHHWLPWIDFGLLLLVPPNQAKRASMPTKLGEFFACGVSPIAYGANAEMVDWVDRSGSGLALRSLSDAELRRAADFVAEGVPSTDVLARARSAADQHFSLSSGVARYDALFQNVLGL